MQDYSEASDEVITREIRDSNTRAFKALYIRYYDSLYRFILLRLGSAETSRDFVQDIFTRLWQNRRGLKADKSLRAYLFRIVNNLITDHFRRQKTQRSHAERLF
ncbi:MAG: sigma-70 family RNA polymerase sigma factor, partial [Actinobacteria bacterium]|nr:sigma-70 family RNA polymerase sigma factor [Actinomycetota bacterium]